MKILYGRLLRTTFLSIDIIYIRDLNTACCQFMFLRTLLSLRFWSYSSLVAETEKSPPIISIIVEMGPLFKFLVPFIDPIMTPPLTWDEEIVIVSFLTYITPSYYMRQCI